MLRDLVDSISSIYLGFCEEVLKVIYQGGLHIFMRVHDVPFIGGEVRDPVGMSPLNDHSMEKFGVALPLFEPLHP